MTTEAATDSDALILASDRLVRRLFHTGLHLHKLCAALGTGPTDRTRIELRSTLDDLDTIIRDAGLAMLARARDNRNSGLPSNV